MESFQISKPSDNEMCQDSYEFSAEDLADIPCPDDICSPAEDSSPEDYIELPLPPGTSEDDFPIPLPPKQDPVNISNTFSPSLHVNKAFENTSDLKLVPENLDILAFDDSDRQNIDVKEDLSEVSGNKSTDFLDDGKYSPSKIDSDEENQDFTAIKPKVLGKEQAKKRLMAFSLSKQPSASIKKQSKTATPAKNKEKPPNPNKGSNVQEQFRATISAIEEEKKKMFQNMPSYLLLEMSELAKSSHSSMSASAQLLEKLKNENTDSKSKDSGKDGSNSNKSSERGKIKRSFRRSRSGSNSRNSKRRRRSRSKRRSKSRSRSRSRSKRSLSRSRRRSPNRSRRSRSRSRRSRDKNHKTDNKVLYENQSTTKKKLFENWNSFKAAGMVINSRQDEHHKRSRSPGDKSDFKPTFDYLNKRSSPMTCLQVKSTDSGSSSAAVYLEKNIKYTRTKPILCWAENPSFATEFYMPKQMLLENCDETATSLLLNIIESKGLIHSEEEAIFEGQPNRSWYPRESYLISKLCTIPKKAEKQESFCVKKSLQADYPVEDKGEALKENKKDVNSDIEEIKKEKTMQDKKISLVNDSYLSDEEDQIKELFFGDVKVKLNLDMNRVKVRSKWDSDYEGENSEKELIFRTEDKKKIIAKVQVQATPSDEKQMDDLNIPPYQETLGSTFEKKKLSPFNSQGLNVEPPKVDASEITAGDLVSEYEEFLKMVSVDSSDNHNEQKENMLESRLKIEKLKSKKSEKLVEENQRVQSTKLGFTDWDQESDHEVKTNDKKAQLVSASESHDDFLLAKKNEKSELKLETEKKKLPKKKTEKLKAAKKKLYKKSNKAKKKKLDDSYSEDSSSDSYESDSDSDSDDSDDSDSSGKKKKKKISKAKRKSRRDSSSESDSSSDECKTKKKKTKKKKSSKRKSSISDDSEEVETKLLKHLDFKKHLIMKKFEEIDSSDDKGSKKKEIRGKKKEKDSSDKTDTEEEGKSGKKKKTELKLEKGNKKAKQKGKQGKISGRNKKSKRNKSTSESDSESSDESFKKMKNKKTGKKKRDSSESSDTEKREKTKSKSSKSSKKRKKSKRDSSSSDTDDDSDSIIRDKKKTKKKASKVKSDDEKTDKEPNLSFRDNLLLDEAGIGSEERSAWERKNLWTGKSKKKREDDDWETSSSGEESEQECKARGSTWDDEIVFPKEACSEAVVKVDSKNNTVVPEKEFTLSNSTNTSEANNQFASVTLKTSLSNFSFNENSFCSFGQELSRDFFLADRSYSNSGNISNGDNLKTCLIDPRPFQSVSKDSENRKPSNSELYSPGRSDSELSEAEANKFEKGKAENGMREALYDPLNCDSEASVENNEIELSSIPLPRVADILLPDEPKNTENVDMSVVGSNSEGGVLRDLPRNATDKLETKTTSITSPVKSCFTTSDFTPVVTSQSPFNEEKSTPTKRQLMSVKGQHKLKSKAASVFQDESDEENVEPLKKGLSLESVQSDAAASLKEKEKISDDSKRKLENDSFTEEKIPIPQPKKESRDRSRERSNDREERRRRSRSREKRESTKSRNKKVPSPSRKRKSKTPEPSREKREIRSDSFEIEPLKSSLDSNEVADMVQPIPVLTGLEKSSSEGVWSRSLVSICDFPNSTDNLIDHAESFDIYPSEESKFHSTSYEKDCLDREKSSMEKSRDPKNKKERRRSRSRSYSPRKKIRSKSPERRKSPKSRSPRRRSVSPKRRDRSPFSPRRRSPKRKSPSRRYKNSRSPDKRRKSPSRSPRKRRSTSSRRSRSISPRKYRSPKHRDESPRRKDSPRMFSPRDRFSPRKDLRYPQPYPDGLQNRIPVIGTSAEDVDMEMSPSALRSPFESSMGFSRHLPDASVTETEIYNSFYEGEYTDEFGVRSYPDEVGVNNLITVKNHDIEKANSPERLSLDQRIELELHVPMSGSQPESDQYQMANQVCPPFQEVNQNHFQNSYPCDNTNISNDGFYQNQNVQMNADFNGQYFNGHQQPQQPPPSYVSFSQYPNSQPVQNSVLQVGNIVEVVPTLQHPPQSLPSKSPQIMQVGNVLQVVPSQKATPPVYGPPEAAPMAKTQKATAVVAPSSIVPTPNPEIVLNPLIKAIQLEREKRRKEKEKRKAEREARRKARQLRREAKLMSVNEKLKKSVQNEGLMLGQEVEDDELLDALDVPSPPIPVEIITVSSPSALPPAGKGILITAGFKPKPPSEKKEVKFADGICPGEGTSTSGGEEISSPPPKPKLPKEKRFKKKKTKVKKKVKVQIIRQIIQEEDDEEDDLSPPPPPPGDPPPVFFARFPFAGDAQFPVYQTQTTTTTLTTIQYPAQTFE